MNNEFVKQCVILEIQKSSFKLLIVTVYTKNKRHLRPFLSYFLGYNLPILKLTTINTKTTKNADISDFQIEDN